MNDFTKISSDSFIDASKLVSDSCDKISPEVFTSELLYKREQQKIFQRNWCYLAHESQLKKPGDFVSAYIGEVPVIVAKGSDGKIVASVNSCPHRGLRVCRADQGNTARFVCPYHTWTFRTTGDLVGFPQAAKINHSIDRKAYGLPRVPRLEIAYGLIFGCLNADIQPLDTYLGDMRFYMDAFFNRFPGGLEIVGPAHKWQLQCNWKLPVENMLGDVGHAAFLHGSLVPQNSPMNQELEDYAVTAVTEPGHSAVFRLMPETATAEQIATHDPSSSPELMEYLTEVERTVADRLSPVKARIKGMAMGIYPNLSLLWGQSTLRVSHPRAPGLIEYWSWWLTPVAAPAHLHKELLSKYNTTFGPSGVLEQEDSYAWSQQFDGASISYLNDRPYYYGLGMGEEFDHDQIPGKIGKVYNEHYARSFYDRWRQDMFGEEK